MDTLGCNLKRTRLDPGHIDASWMQGLTVVRAVHSAAAWPEVRNSMVRGMTQAIPDLGRNSHADREHIELKNSIADPGFQLWQQLRRQSADFGPGMISPRHRANAFVGLDQEEQDRLRGELIDERLNDPVRRQRVNDGAYWRFE